MKYVPEFVKNIFRREMRTSDRVIGLGDYRGDHRTSDGIYPAHKGGGGGGV